MGAMSRLALVCAIVGTFGLAAAQPAAPPPEVEIESVLSLGGLTAVPRGEQEKIYVQLIAETPDSERDEKSEYLFRLGELYGAQVRSFRARGDQKSSTAALLKAVKTWRTLVDNDALRNYPKMDAALFELGYTLQTGKYMKEARAMYDRLIKFYPQSPLATDAHLMFAEYYREAGQLADAAARYQYVLRFPKARGYAFALYRLGWIQHDQQHDQEALATFQTVVALTKNDPAQAALLAGAQRGLAEASSSSAIANALWESAEAEPNARAKPARWIAAADAYLDVARTAPDPERVRKAAARSVLAWKAALAVDPSPAGQAGRIDLEATARAKPAAIAVPAREEKLAAAFALYESGLTDADEIARTKFLRATLYRRHGDHARAVGLLTELLASYRDHETAELAANLLLDSLIRVRRYDDVLAAVDRFAADPGFLEGKPALAANIKLLRSRSLRRR